MDDNVKLYEVTVLRAHNAKKGREKAPDARYYCFGRNPVEVKDIIETYDRIPGIKCVLSVVPMSRSDFFDESKLISMP